MKRFLLAALLLCTLSGYADAAILVMSTNGAYTTKTTLEVARTAADVAGKTVVVTSPLTEAQSNITAAWPTDRALRVEKGGSINPTTSFSGLSYSTPDMFGAVSGGIIDDTVGVYRALKSLSLGGVFDGGGKTYRVKDIIGVAPTGDLTIKNVKFISGTSAWADQMQIALQTDVNYMFENVTIDGERNTRSNEPWTFYTTLEGFAVQPTTRTPITNYGAAFFTKKITLKNVTFTNLHAPECVLLQTYGTVSIDGFYADNISQKGFHIWHDADTPTGVVTGITHAKNIVVKNEGILPALYLVDGVAKTRADSYNIQGGFGAIVTRGRYTLDGLYAYNYGSTAVTADRNQSFTGNDIQIYHDDANAYSRNSSGALWIEAVDSVNVSNVDINITARDTRETVLDSAALSNFLGAGQTAAFSNVRIKTVAGANLNKAVRGSMGLGSLATYSNFIVDATGSTYAFYSAGNALSGQQTISDSEFIGADSLFYDSPVGVTNTKWAALSVGGFVGTYADASISGGLLSGNLSLTANTGTVHVSGVKVGGNLLVTGTGDINLANNTVAGSTISNGAANSVNIIGGSSTGPTQIIAAKTVSVTGLVTSRSLSLFEYISALVSGCTLRTNAPENVFTADTNAVGTSARLVLQNNAIWIKTGTVSAGYVGFGANLSGAYVDIGNDKATIAW